MAVAGGWVLTDGPRTSQIAPWTTSLTQTYTTSGTTTYNMFKFDLLRNASASANFIALNEIRLNGNDVHPDARITVNADGRVGINTPPAEVNTAAAMTVSGNIAVTGNISAGNLGMFRNRIINGDMRIDQRNAGAAVDVSGGIYTLDRWVVSESAATAVVTAQQVNAPANPYGFVNALVTTVTSAQSVIAVQEACKIEHRIEGLNVADFMWGTSYASPISVSFYVYTTQIGSYNIAIRNATFTSSYISTFTVLTANQWTRVEKIISGSTSAVWNIDNTIGLYLTITLAAGANWLTSNANTWIDGSRAASGYGYLGFNGQVNFLGTVNNQFFLTGVQVEKGTILTPFEVRPLIVELQLCQRYTHVFLGGSLFSSFNIFGRGNGTANFLERANIKLSTPLRAIPSLFGVGSFNNFSLANESVNIVITASDISVSAGESSLDNVAIAIGAAGKFHTLPLGGTFNVNSINNTTYYLALNAEL
jgi:hypothetical protein